MTKKIFHSILLVAGAVLLASLFVITGALYEYFGIIQKRRTRPCGSISGTAGR